MSKRMQRGSSGANRQKSSKTAATIVSSGDQIVKRMTFSGVTLATGAGTTIPLTTESSGLVQSAPAAEWASFAARFQQYRVRKLIVRGKAINPVQSATVAHSVLYRGDFIGSSAPAGSSQVFSDENVRTCGTHEDFVDVVTWARNPNARLWNPTTAVPPTANLYAWACASPVAPVLTTATTYYAVTLEWEVEFRGSQ